MLQWRRQDQKLEWGEEGPHLSWALIHNEVYLLDRSCINVLTEHFSITLSNVILTMNSSQIARAWVHEEHQRCQPCKNTTFKCLVTVAWVQLNAGWGCAGVSISVILGQGGCSSCKRRTEEGIRQRICSVLEEESGTKSSSFPCPGEVSQVRLLWQDSSR